MYGPVPRRATFGIASALVATLVSGATAIAATVIYGLHDNGIYSINVATGAATALYTGAPFGAGAGTVQGGAQRASDGIVFFLEGAGANQQVYTYDPATPATAPVLLGTTGAGVLLMPRMAFDGAGTLWGVNATGAIYTINQGTGVATATGNTITGANGGGDIAIASNGTWYVAVAKKLYSTTSAGGAATLIGTMGSAGNITGAAFGPGGVLYGVDSSNPSNVYTINTATAGVTSIGSTGIAGNFGDLGSAIAPDIATTKTDNGPFTVGLNGTYTVTVNNIAGSAPTAGTITVTDILPAGIGYVSAAGTGWACGAAGATVTCASGTAIAAGATGQPITIVVTVDGAAAPTVTNTATATGGNVPAYHAADGVGSDTTAVSLNSGGNLLNGPVDNSDGGGHLGAEYTGSYDGIVTAANNNDFTARSIPFAGNPALVNSGTTAGVWVGNTIVTGSVTFGIPNMLYYSNTTIVKHVLTFTPTLPATPAGWSVQLCPDNGVGVAGSGTGGNGPSAGCAIPGGAGSCVSPIAPDAWLTTGATATYCVTSNLLGGPFTLVYWAVYTTPASGLVAFTRYDASIRVVDDQASPLSNMTHNELYASFIPITKTASVVSNGCPAGVAPPANGTCPGGVVKYTLDYRNIMAGGGSGTESALTATFIYTKVGQLSITDDGTLGANNWFSNSAGLIVALSAGGSYAATCGVGAGACGDSTAGTTFVYTPGPGGIGASKFVATIGGAAFSLKAPGTGGTSQGTIVFAVRIK